MNEPAPLFWEVFFDVYEALPRQGPGNRACAEKALDTELVFRVAVLFSQGSEIMDSGFILLSLSVKSLDEKRQRLIDGIQFITRFSTK